MWRSQIKSEFGFPVWLLLQLGMWGLFFSPAVVSAAESYSSHTDASYIADATNYLGNWIWAKHTGDKQTCRFWHSFEIPRGVTVSSARMFITVDNGYRLFLDGREIGRGSDWKTLTEYDIRRLLNPGEHVLAVEGFNERLQAGLIFGLRIHLSDGRVVKVVSDKSWYVLPLTETSWESRKKPAPTWSEATVVGSLGGDPWRNWPYAVETEPPIQPVKTYLWQTGWFQIALITACGLAVLACLWLLTQLTLKSKAQRLLHLQRARIARDIHDDLGARLTHLVLLGELAQNELPVQSEIRTQIDRICESARDLANAMDEVVWAVSSRRDTLRDFANFACKYAQLYLKSTSVRCRLDVEADLPALPFDLASRRNLLLAVKEAISNVARHSGATEMFLRIHRHASGVRVAVEDNGRGFVESQAAVERNGLANMAQRMREVGGRFVMNSRPGAGCRVEFTLPLTHERHRPWFLNRFWTESATAEEPEYLMAAAGSSQSNGEDRQ